MQPHKADPRPAKSGGQGTGEVGSQSTYTADEVALMLGLVYVTGLLGHDQDIAEMRYCWQIHADPRRTYEQRVAARIAEMERHAERVAEQMGRPGYVYRGGPVDFETGRPVRRLAVAV